MRPFEILTEAADLISDQDKFVRDYAARGWNPSEVARGGHRRPNAQSGTCLPTGEYAERWNALGALWRRALTEEKAVKKAHSFFMRVIGDDVSVNRWCSAHGQAEQVQALRKAAKIAEAA